MTPSHLYAALLHLYPRRFRLEYGEEMVEAFRSTARDTRMAPAPFWLFIIEDVCRSACSEHLHDVEPGLRHLARCTVALVVSTAVLAGGIAVAVLVWGDPTRPIAEDLLVTELSTGWIAGSVENGNNKLVPSVTVTLKNVSNKPVGTVRLNAIFRRVGETKTWGGAYVPDVRLDGFPPQAPATPIFIRSPLGYTGTEPSRVLLRKKQFVDVRVTVMAKRGSAQWQALGEWRVQRELLELHSWR